MAESPHYPCKTVKCSGIVKRPEKFCDKCKEAGEEKADKKGKWKGKSGDPFYSSKEWRSTREQVLGSLDSWCTCEETYCEHIGRCNRLSQVVDHKIPRNEGGSDDIESGNLTPMCKKCHDRKTANKDATGARGQQVILVAGPSGSGKTTYVRKNKKQSDLVWDFDVVAKAISGYPYHLLPPHIKRFVYALRDAFLKEAEKRIHDGVKTIWIIESAPKPEQRRKYQQVLRAKVIVLEVPAQECLRRIETDPKRDMSFEWKVIIDRWWSSYGPCDGEQRIKDNG